MKKYSLILTVTLGMVTALIACGGNADTNTSDNNTEMKAEDQAEFQVENQVDIRAGNQDNAQVDDQVIIREENETKLKQVSESAMDGDEMESQQTGEPAANDNEIENKEIEGEQTDMKMNVQIGNYNFTATLENNKAVKELVDMMKDGPVTISMDDYSGFEKVGPLGRSFTTSDSQTTTDAGDIVLYNGNNIVMFYGSNSWSYTRIGKIEDLTNWNKALGSGSITAVFTIGSVN